MVTLDEREARFKAMLQYLILREACEFDDKFPRDDSGAGDALEASRKKQEDEFKKKSAEKILREMELKFYDLFVEDDLVEDYLFLDAPCKTDAINQKSQFKNQIQEQILNKITSINSTDTADTREVRKHNKELLEKIVRSPKIENLIMTCCLSTESKESYLISDIDNVFQSRDLASIEDNSLVKIRDEFLFERENEFCKISENSIAIQAQLNTATSLSLGFLNLTGKIIAKALGDLSGVLLPISEKTASPSESVRGEKISKILDSLQTHYYV